jgi:2-polyprenyl-3-methyl-5-hydroxy-6-metoxy-1,4-benzoquinol methylase
VIVVLPPESLLRQIAGSLPPEVCAEMALPSYLHRNPAMVWMATSRLRVVAQWARERMGAGATLMDFGCGAGVLFPDLGPRAGRLYGVDLVLAPARTMVEYLHLDNVVLLLPAELPARIPAESVDVLICGEVLEHVDALPNLLQVLREKLRPEGRLMVTAPTENALYRLGRRLAGFQGDYHVRDAEAVHEAVLRSGFRQVRSRPLPLPGPLAIYRVFEYERC